MYQHSLKYPAWAHLYKLCLLCSLSIFYSICHARRYQLTALRALS